MRRFLLPAVLGLLWGVVVAQPLMAQEKQGISLIRDAESEALIHEMAEPVLKAAGLSPKSVKFYIVNSPVLNAFVAGGQNIFLTTGLITWSDDPSVVIGVIAHEAGHIAGGHLVRSRETLENMSIGTLMSYVLGAATIAAGAPEAGQAILTGGSHIAQSMALRFTRGKEEAADQAALHYLKQVQVSPKGLIALLTELNSQQRRKFERLNPYTQTHPLSTERIQFLENAMAPPEAYQPVSASWQARYARVTAKIRGFIDPPEQVARRYLSSDSSAPAEIARAVLQHRQGDVSGAAAKVDALLKAQPEDPYLQELKGQFLYEGGRVAESIRAYSEAADRAPQQPMVLLGLGVAQLASGQYDAAIATLKRVTVLERENAIAWRQLGIAYSKAGQEGASYLALAEEALLRRSREEADRFLKLAEPLVAKNTALKVQYEDAKRALEQLRREKDEKDEKE